MNLARMLPEGADRQQRERVLQQSIDSLEDLPVPLFYGNAPTEKVLAVPVHCKYSISVPGASSAVTETFDFWLTPDGNTVLHQRKSK